MNYTCKIRQGDTSPYFLLKSVNASTDLSGTDWICRQSVSNPRTRESLSCSSPIYNADKGGFIVYLNSTDTSSLSVGVYTWTVELSNSSIVPQYKREIWSCNLTVKDQMVLS
jgi:hypothetical protein